MSHTKPQVIIDLDEYNELKKDYLNTVEPLEEQVQKHELKYIKLVDNLNSILNANHPTTVLYNTLDKLLNELNIRKYN